MRFLYGMKIRDLVYPLKDYHSRPSFKNKKGNKHAEKNWMRLRLLGAAIILLPPAA
jgi:hypothetical protein